MNWFERLTGFPERDYYEVREKLEVRGQALHSSVNGKSYRIGSLELVPLGDLRERVFAEPPQNSQLRLSVVQGDVRSLHRMDEYKGALFQVASQFNLLEMVSPNVTPEHGVARYENDRTQGPACAIAAGAATVYRNYFVPVDGESGQRADRQLDGLADLGHKLAAAIKTPVESLWQMENGYAMCTSEGLHLINDHLLSLGESEVDELRSALRIGLHWDVEVTDVENGAGPLVSQAFCSALPVAYSGLRNAPWRQFASLILEATYEATLWAGVLNARRGASNTVLLTMVGGGAFGNDAEWIASAMQRALEMAAAFDLDVKVVSFGGLSSEMTLLVNRFS